VACVIADDRWLGRVPVCAAGLQRNRGVSCGCCLITVLTVCRVFLSPVDDWQRFPVMIVSSVHGGWCAAPLKFADSWALCWRPMAAVKPRSLTFQLTAIVMLFEAACLCHAEVVGVLTILYYIIFTIHWYPSSPLILVVVEAVDLQTISGCHALQCILDLHATTYNKTTFGNKYQFFFNVSRN